MKEICALYYHLQSLGTYKENRAEKIEKILGRKIPVLYHIRYGKANLQHALDEKKILEFACAYWLAWKEVS